MANPVPNPPLRDAISDASVPGIFGRVWSRYWQTIQQFLGNVIVTPGLLSAIPAPTNQDAGLLYFVSDFNHILEWDGASWQWAPGENGSGYIANFQVSPPNPLTGWHLCDGSSVNILNHDGTVTLVALPVIANSYFRL